MLAVSFLGLIVAKNRGARFLLNKRLFLSGTQQFVLNGGQEIIKVNLVETIGRFKFDAVYKRAEKVVALPALELLATIRE